ncbi:MAG: hypothetical protein EAZ99_12380 [Alphaproteobacteria bacterium]|nr:MAG: hypothetical protein EAZ99_12380 [Alphaproteobacteria bacterium]
MAATTRRIAAACRWLGVPPAPPVDAVGSSHDHAVTAAGRLRLPRHQDAARFAAAKTAFRALAGEHAPRLLAEIPPLPDLPLGGLLVEHITGRLPQLPADGAAIGRALAALHAHPLDAALATLPRQSFASLRQEALTATPALPALRRLQQALAAAPAVAEPAPVLLLSDCHPGNWLIRASGEAVAVDIDWVATGPAALDLADALHPWAGLFDPRLNRWLTPADTASVRAAYHPLPPPEALAEAHRLITLRTCLWLSTAQLGPLTPVRKRVLEWVGRATPLGCTRGL